MSDLPGIEIVPVRIEGEGHVAMVRRSLLTTIQNELRLANQKLLHESARADRLAGELHKLRGELDRLKRSLATSDRLLGATLRDCAHMKASRELFVKTCAAHAQLLDEFTAAAGEGDLGRLAELAESWRDRD